ncbi:MAG TPA: alpha/beta hydrolase [Devosia sp.]|jgi:pimeloyl-ACP methyl ester carboxylesterase|uniref:alpha/beta fold hydrolase n=1 Tax=Devosia sp. TaxID=1871048 RepID=UPI002DDD4BBB|nr:alpha/beta hydrolase [Devosia sp.]HEV2513828.1 alpha/beta hydrolase [Devosia sp.]
MLRRTFVSFTLIAAALVAAPAMAQTAKDFPMSTPSSTGRVPVDGVEIYYEIHGNGPPLVLLHGGVTPSTTFGAPLEAMAKTQQVIAIHLRGHGHSSDSEAPWSGEVMADDVAAVLRHLGLSKARVMGYSLGAAVALQVAIRHPDLVEKLVSVSVAFSTEGDYPEVRQAFAEMTGKAAAIGQQLAASPLAALYPGVDWERVMRKSAAMNQPERDWSEAIKTIKAPTLLVFADADSIRPEHMVAFWKLLGGGQRDAGLDGSQRPASQLSILPGTTHYSVIEAPLLIEAATAFLRQ